MAVVKAAIAEAEQGANEEWISERELLKTFQMFTHDWIRRYGELLPRTRAIVSDGEKTSSTSWAYAKHKIQKMIMNDDIRQLKIRSYE